MRSSDCGNPLYPFRISLGEGDAAVSLFIFFGLTSDNKVEAADILRTLVEAIVMVPEDGELKVELRGDIAGILSLCQTSKKAAGFTPNDLEQVNLVAGVGFSVALLRSVLRPRTSESLIGFP